MKRNILDELTFTEPVSETPVIPAEPVQPEPPAVEPPATPPAEPTPPVVEPVPAPAAPPVEPVEPVTPPVVPPAVPAAEVPEDYKAKADFLAKELERLLGLKPIPATSAQPAVPAAPVASAPVVPEVIAFLKDDDEFVEAINNRENFNALLNKVFQQGRQSTLKDIPSLVGNQVEERVSITLAAKDFYDRNPDLVPHKGYIALIANELQAQHPDFGLDKLLLETESEARKRLVVAKPVTPATPAKPAFAAPPNARPATPGKSANPVQADIDDMFKAING